MALQGNHRQQISGKQPGRATTSLLVRCWLEPREGGEPVLRGVIRNLATGEETFIGDVAAVGQHILAQLGQATPTIRTEERRSSAAGAGGVS